MTNVWKWFFGVDRIDLRGNGGDIVLRFLDSWPAWIAFLAALAAIGYVIIIYLRENPETPPVVRGFLIFLRSAIILLLLAMIMTPALVLLRNIEIKSSAVIALDTTESMTINDAAESSVAAPQAQVGKNSFSDVAQTAASQTAQASPAGAVVESVLARAGVKPVGDEPMRSEAALAALKLNEAAALRKLAGEQQLHFYQFSNEPKPVERIDSADQVAQLLEKLDELKFDGKRSMPTRSLEMILEQLSGQTVTGLLLISDGRSTTASDLSKLREMALSRNIPIFTMALGSSKNPSDVELLRVNTEERAFINEELAVKVELRHTGFEGQTVRVSLDVADNPKLSTWKDVTLLPGRTVHEVPFSIKPEDAGRYELQASIRPMPGEFDLENNVSLPTYVEVIDRKVKVLLVDDMPRWEYQYIKNALFRDPSVQVSVLLNWADPDFPPEGDIPIRRFPADKEKLAEYDVIILGDVNKQNFSQEQMQNIHDFVQNGGGLILIAGTRFHNPNGYIDTPLEPLLPVDVNHEQPVGPFVTSFKPQVTLEGAVSPLMRFEPNIEDNRQVWNNLPGMFWYYQCREPKPSAQVLLEHPEDINPLTDKPYPLMLLQPVGAGKVFFTAVDATWRWRYYTGAIYMNRFWIQMVRFMALPQQQAVMETSAFRYVHGDKVTLQLRVADRNNIDEKTETIEVMVRRRVADDETVEQSLQLRRKNPAIAIYEIDFVPEQTGRYEVEAMPQLKSGAMSTTAEFIVTASREEFLEPVCDVNYLADLAESTGGRMIGLSELENFAGLIQANNRSVPDDLPDEVWDAPIMLLVFIGLIGTEWILRKRQRML